MLTAPVTGHSIRAEIPYTVDTGETLVNETFGPNNIRRHRTGTQEIGHDNLDAFRPIVSLFFRKYDRDITKLIQLGLTHKDPIILSPAIGSW